MTTEQLNKMRVGKTTYINGYGNMWNNYDITINVMMDHGHLEEQTIDNNQDLNFSQETLTGDFKLNNIMFDYLFGENKEKEFYIWVKVYLPEKSEFGYYNLIGCNIKNYEKSEKLTKVEFTIKKFRDTALELFVDETVEKKLNFFQKLFFKLKNFIYLCKK